MLQDQKGRMQSVRDRGRMKRCVVAEGTIRVAQRRGQGPCEVGNQESMWAACVVDKVRNAGGRKRYISAGFCGWCARQVSIRMINCRTEHEEKRLGKGGRGEEEEVGIVRVGKLMGKLTSNRLGGGAVWRV